MVRRSLVRSAMKTLYCVDMNYNNNVCALSTPVIAQIDFVPDICSLFSKRLVSVPAHFAILLQLLSIIFSFVVLVCLFLF